MKSKRKTRTWSRRLERNILACYQAANESDRNEGLFWYAQAHEQAELLSARYGITVEQSAGVIAAISPGLQWGLNVLQAEQLIKAHLEGTAIPMIGVYGKGNIHKAIAILSGTAPLDALPITGPKVRAFYSCILDPKSSLEVCIDRHAKCLALNESATKNGYASNDANAIVTRAEYPYYVWHYRKLAERLGLIPHQLQAIVWIAWRRLQGKIETEKIKNGYLYGPSGDETRTVIY